MSRKSHSKKDNKILYFQNLAESNINIAAMNDHRDNKGLTIHDLKDFKPITEPLRQMAEAYYSGMHIMAIGSGGTGKSTYSLYLALNELLDPNSNKESIVIIRSGVATRDLGALPGDILEKQAIFEDPYRDIFAEITGKMTAYDKCKKNKLVEFKCSSYLRSCTFKNSIIFVDEIQNFNFAELYTVMTRIGKGSRIILSGDNIQNDLLYNSRDTSGLPKLQKVIDIMQKEFCTVTFTSDDIIRSGIVKSFIKACEDIL